MARTTTIATAVLSTAAALAAPHASAQAWTAPYPGSEPASSPSVYPPNGSSYSTTADVVSVTPVIERVADPVQQCRIETYGPNGTVTTRPAVPGSGRSFLLPGSTEVERCVDTTTTREVIRGYDVVYRYDGRDFTARLPYDPGPRLAVQVAVSPGAR